MTKLEAAREKWKHEYTESQNFADDECPWGVARSAYLAGFDKGREIGRLEGIIEVAEMADRPVEDAEIDAIASVCKAELAKLLGEK